MDQPVPTQLPPTDVGEWSTTDMYLAAFLRQEGQKMLRYDTRTEPDSRRRIVFVFVKTSDLERLKKDYHSGEAKTSAFGLVSRIKELKSVVHS